MRKLVVLIALSLSFSNSFSQTNTILLQAFDGTTFPPSGWTIIDHDGDGKNWYHRTDSQTGNKMASSRSYESGALTPHNLLITSQINFSDFSSTHRLRLAFRVAATGNNYFQEHYKVVLSTTGNTFADFASGTILFEETLTQAESGWNFKPRSINVEAYAGQQFYLAWVHYNCTNMDALLIDDIHIYEGDDPTDLPYSSWIVGSTDDVLPQNFQPGIVLAGGAGDNSDAMKWFLNRADGGDIVVIRASGTDGYNNYLYSSLNITVNSVETILINSREAAEHPYVEQQIRNAEGLFIAGGDQSDYYNFWKDTPVMDAINYLINEKGVVVGGTSAGMAILGKVYYAPTGSGAQSSTVLQNPYHSSTNIIGRDDFISTPVLENTITDTHFDQRDRSGRLFTFLARMVTDWGIEAKGIAANEYTAVCIDSDGKAFVFGNPSYDDYAYFLSSQSCNPEVCTSGQPLTWNCNYQAVKVYKILGKQTSPDFFNLADWETGQGGIWEYWYAVNGTLFKSPITSTSSFEKGNAKVFPNPSSGKMIVSLCKEIISGIEVVSPSGKIIKRFGYLNDRIVDLNLTELPSGVYLLRITTATNTYTERIIVI